MKYFETVLFVLCSVLLPHGDCLSCPQGRVILNPGETQAALPIFPCPRRRSSYSCSVTKVIATFGGQEKTMFVGKCFPTLFCSQNMCSIIVSALGSLLQGLDAKATSCSFKCCENNDCKLLTKTPTVHNVSVDNKPSEQVVKPTKYCLQGTQIKRPGESHAAMPRLPCPNDHLSYNCSRTKIVVDENGQEATILVGKCISTETCSRNMCPMILNNMSWIGNDANSSVKSCSFKCCEGEYCNSSINVQSVSHVNLSTTQSNNLQSVNHLNLPTTQSNYLQSVDHSNLSNNIQSNNLLMIAMFSFLSLLSLIVLQ